MALGKSAKTIKGLMALAIEETVGDVAALQRERKVGEDHKGLRALAIEENVSNVVALAREEIRRRP